MGTPFGPSTRRTRVPLLSVKAVVVSESAKFFRRAQYLLLHAGALGRHFTQSCNSIARFAAPAPWLIAIAAPPPLMIDREKFLTSLAIAARWPKKEDPQLFISQR